MQQTLVGRESGLLSHFEEGAKGEKQVPEFNKNCDSLYTCTENQRLHENI